MFNFSSLLNLFKKKPIEPLGSESPAGQPVVEKQIQINNIAIHTMPERFRHQPARADSAKNTGLLIVGGGVLVLIVASALLYNFLFKKPAVTTELEPPVATATPPPDANQVQPEIGQSAPDLAAGTATTTEQLFLPVDNSLATGTATSTPAAVEPELTLGLIPALDSDHDGLTDAEEIILRTGTSTPDTDGDGYLDGFELLNLYDPAGPGKLAANPDLAPYENKNFNYSLLYPGAWQLTVNGGDDSIMFKTPDNQFLQIVVQPNTAEQPLDEWYMEQLDETAINDLNRVSGANWQGIKNLDGLTLYLMDSRQKYIFTLAYNPGENNILDYIDIFSLMIKSFILKDQP